MPTMLPKAPVVAALDDVWASLDTLLAGLDDADWKRPTCLPGWNVQAVAAHLIGTESMLLGVGAPELTISEATHPHVRNDIGTFNEAWVEALDRVENAVRQLMRRISKDPQPYAFPDESPLREINNALGQGCKSPSLAKATSSVSHRTTYKNLASCSKSRRPWLTAGNTFPARKNWPAAPEAASSTSRTSRPPLALPSASTQSSTTTATSS